MWTEEQRKAASERAKVRWSKPGAKEQAAKARARPPSCPTCGETDISKFYVGPEGYRTNKKCRECHKKECNQRWHSRSQIDKWASRCHKYGVTKEFVLELYAKQNGKCAICGNPSQTKRFLHVDHCHKTGAVRGLLCHGCNVGIGALRDDPDIISKALHYLKG